MSINNSTDSAAQPTFFESFLIYADSRMPRILLLGIISGFPWVLIGSALTLWLKEEGLSRSTVAQASLIFSVYSINYLWAPMLDRIRIPGLTNLFGHRKAWIILFQLIMIGCLLLWSGINPTDNLVLVIFIGIAIAFASASQDITIDALRIEQIDPDDRPAMAAGAAVAVVGWWSGYKLGGAFALWVADILQQRGFENYWQITFLVLTGLIVLCNLLLLFIPEESAESRILAQQRDQAEWQSRIGQTDGAAAAASWLSSALISPLVSFFRSNGFALAVSILAFIFLFKIGEAFMGRMSLQFYNEMEFSKSEIAIYSKTLGWVTTVVFTLLGGWLSIRSGVIRALFISGVLMATTNVLFSVLYWTGKSELMFAVAVIADDIAAAFATVAFVAFISLLVDRTYTATQYALLASLGTLGRTVLSSQGGKMVDWLGGDWGTFFVITALMVLPSLILLFLIRNQLDLEEQELETV